VTDLSPGTERDKKDARGRGAARAGGAEHSSSLLPNARKVPEAIADALSLISEACATVRRRRSAVATFPDRSLGRFPSIPAARE